MNIEHVMLLIFPLIVFIFMLIKVKIAPRKTFHEDFLSLKSTNVWQGLAALGVLFHHLSQTITNYGNEWKGLFTLFSFMGIFFTSIFFFCSGYGLVVSYRTKPDYLKGFLKKRLPKVLLPFLVSNAIYYVLVAFYFGRVEGVLDSLGYLFGWQLVNTNTWYLVEIIILYLAFYITYRFVKNKKAALGLMCGFVGFMIVGSLLLCHDQSQYGGHWFMGEWWYNSTGLFAIGMVVGHFYDKITAFFKKQYAWLLPVTIFLNATMFVITQIVMKFFGYYQEWEGHPGYGAKVVSLFAQFISCVLFVLLVLLISMKVKVYNKVLAFLGTIGLEIYIIQDLFIQHMKISEEITDLGLVTWVVVLTIFVAIPFYWAMDLLLDIYRRFTDKTVEEPRSREAAFEQKRKEKQQRKVKIICIIVAVVVGAAAMVELYKTYRLPQVYYQEEVETLAGVMVGDEILFGMYDTDPKGTGNERIEWYVADVQGNKVLLISKYALEPQGFHNANKDTNWEESNVRELLNDYFYNEAFSEYEQELIVSRKLDNPGNVEYGIPDGEATQDKIFLLSATEAELYFPTEEERKVEPTPMALRYGINSAPDTGFAYEIRTNRSWWWLRTDAIEENYVVTVDTQGRIDWEGRNQTVASGAVRPAMWVRR